MGGSLQVSLPPLKVPCTFCSWPRKGKKAIVPGPLAEKVMVTFSSGVCWAISLDFSPLKFARKTETLPPTLAIWRGDKWGGVDLNGGLETGDLEDFGHEGFPELVKLGLFPHARSGLLVEFLLQLSVVCSAGTVRIIDKLLAGFLLGRVCNPQKLVHRVRVPACSRFIVFSGFASDDQGLR